MKTISRLCLPNLALFAALSGCAQPLEEDAAAAFAEPEPGQTARALDEPTDPSSPYFRLRFKHTTIMAEQGTRPRPTCFEPVDITKSAPVVQRDCNTSAPGPNDPQSFYIDNPTNRTDGRRMIHLAQNPSRCLMVAGYWQGAGALDAGPAVVVFDCQSSRENQWFYLDLMEPDNYSVIRASHSNMTLAVPGSSSDNNALVFQYPASSPPGAAWLIFRDKGNGVPAPW
jgi:hypothetical protein